MVSFLRTTAQVCAVLAFLSRTVTATCHDRPAADIQSRLAYVQTFLSGIAQVDHADNPQQDESASVDAKITNMMLSFKQLSARLTCAHQALQPFESSADPDIMKAANRVAKLYEKQIKVFDRILDLVREEVRTDGPSPVSQADAISTLKLETKDFWSDLGDAASDAPLLLFTNGRDKDGTLTTVRMTIPEHVALLRQLTGPEFSYVFEPTPHSYGPGASIFAWLVAFGNRPLIHPDGGLFPEKSLLQPNKQK